MAARDTDHADQLVGHAEGARVVVAKVSDRTFLMHLGGKIEMTSSTRSAIGDDLPMITPRGCRVCLAISEEPRRRRRSHQTQRIAVITDGRLFSPGNIALRQHCGDGRQGRPFKRFAVSTPGRLSGYPGRREIIAVVRAVAPGAPASTSKTSPPSLLEVEARLREQSTSRSSRRPDAAPPSSFWPPLQPPPSGATRSWSRSAS